MSDHIKDLEVEAMVMQLLQKYPELLDHIKPDRLLFVREISRSQKTKPGNCLSVKPPYNLLNPQILYIIVIYYKASWDDLNSAHRSALVMHQLLHISSEFDGTLFQHDINDFAFLVDNLGSNYLENGQVGNLLNREDGVVENLDTSEETEEVLHGNQ